MISIKVFMLFTVFAAYTSELYLMNLSQILNTSTDECLAIAYNYLQLKSPVIKESIVVKLPANSLGSIRLTKIQLGTQTILSLINAYGASEALVWSTENPEDQSWTMLKCYNNHVASQITRSTTQKLFWQSGLDITTYFPYDSQALLTYPGLLCSCLEGTYKYSLFLQEAPDHKDLDGPSIATKNCRFFSDHDLTKISLIDFFILNIVSILAKKNEEEAWIITKFLQNRHVRSLIQIG